MTKVLARIIHEGRLTSLSNVRIGVLAARRGTDDASLGSQTLTFRDFGSALAA